MGTADSPEGEVLHARLPSLQRLPPELIPLAYAIVRSAPGALPDVEEARWRAIYEETAVRNLFLAVERDALLDGAAEKGIEVVPVKGALFMDLLYRDFATRPMSDIDVLIDPRDLPGIDEILRHRGYETLPLRGGSIRFTHHVVFKGKALIEVHVRLPDELGTDPAIGPTLGRTTWASIRGRRLRVLSPEDQFLFTAVHAANHAFGHSALWPIDLFLLARADAQPRWDVVLAEAERQRATRALAHAITWARRALGVPVAPRLPVRAAAARHSLLRQLLAPWPDTAPGKAASLAARVLLHNSLSGAVGSFLQKGERSVRDAVRREGRDVPPT